MRMLDGSEVKAMKINRNQKSVLTLAIIVAGAMLFGTGISGLFSIEAIVLWIILACWFYGVRTKKVSN
jgi:hypothetical protein